MSTTYESVLVLGYALTIEEVDKLMRKSEESCWDDDYFKENEGYDSMKAEEYAATHDLCHFYRGDSNTPNKPHVIGYNFQPFDFNEMDNIDEVELTPETFKNIEKESKKIKERLKQDKEPCLISVVFSY